MSSDREKSRDYADKIYRTLIEIFEEGHEHYIDMDELEEGNNANCFFHALANAAPKAIYLQLVDPHMDMLGFNHVANRLAFEFIKPPKSNDDEE